MDSVLVVDLFRGVARGPPRRPKMILMTRDAAWVDRPIMFFVGGAFRELILSAESSSQKTPGVSQERIALSAGWEFALFRRLR